MKNRRKVTGVLYAMLCPPRAGDTSIFARTRSDTHDFVQDFSLNAMANRRDKWHGADTLIAATMCICVCMCVWVCVFVCLYVCNCQRRPACERHFHSYLHLLFPPDQRSTTNTSPLAYTQVFCRLPRPLTRRDIQPTVFDRWTKEPPRFSNFRTKPGLSPHDIPTCIQRYRVKKIYRLRLGQVELQVGNSCVLRFQWVFIQTR